MRYLVVYQNGKREEFYAKDFHEFVRLLERGVMGYGAFDLIYVLGMGR